ncbi:zinc-dependent alcohol dehydrogenase family protein [bacterium]|nr:zinc-dependent alcohol dehydrogenase family protein [candidate division CSSED10-310 bacterium]
MNAMVMTGVKDLSRDRQPLTRVELDTPSAVAGEILVRVSTCGVCHTELDEIEGRTPPPRFPTIPGHQVVGRVAAVGPGARLYAIGDRVGIGWIAYACGRCEYCRAGNDNLCAGFLATGRDRDGGYAEYMTIGERFAFPVPDVFSDLEAAPLLCAGAIGYRSFRLAGLNNGQALGLTGFGASGHLVLKMARHLLPDTEVFVFARSEAERAFALELGAVWAGDSTDRAPRLLHAVIDTTPVWKPVVEALVNLAPGGRLIINAIRKEHHDQDSLLNLDYPTHLWMEKEIKSVANVAGRDIEEFLQIAAEIPIKPEYQTYALEDANRALIDLKERRIRGAKVLVIE